MNDELTNNDTFNLWNASGGKPENIYLFQTIAGLRANNDALLARAERAEADLAMAEARCSFLHNENKRLDGLVVERGRMVERLIETGNKIHNVLPDVNVGSRIDRNWQALIAEWSKEHGNVT